MSDSWDTRPPPTPPKRPKPPKAPGPARLTKSPRGGSSPEPDPAPAQGEADQPPSTGGAAPQADRGAAPKAETLAGAGGWGVAPANQTMRRRWWPRLKSVQGLLQFATVCVALLMAAYATSERMAAKAQARRETSQPRVQAVIANVVKTPSDPSSIRELCATYGVRDDLCVLSEKCAPELGSGRAGNGRVVRLILSTPRGGSCAVAADAPANGY